jgi:hypothetical protein
MLTSTRHDVADFFEANELYQANGWTDGLPIVPPTEDLVARFLHASGLDAAEVVGIEPVRRRRITAEKVAIAAVMAGCLPEYMPVVLAVVRAMCAPEFGLHGATASTGGSAPFIVVNGPVRRALGMNATHNALANGSRANATIGRTTRLVVINVLGGVPGELDRSTLGHPGKFTFCVAEDEEDSPWLPLAAERGVPAGESAVTVLCAESPHQVMNEWTRDPREILETYAAAIRGNMLTYSIWSGNYAVVVPKQHRDAIVAAGWTKKDVRDYVFESARMRRGEWRAAGKGAVIGPDEDRVYTALRTPDDLLVVAAGGPAGGFGAVVAPWYGAKALAVTTRVEAPQAAEGHVGAPHAAEPELETGPGSPRDRRARGGVGGHVGAPHMIVTLDPRLDPEQEPLTLAPPLASLDGATIGLLDNAKTGTARFYERLEALLRSRAGAREFIRRRKPDTSRPAPPPMLRELAAAHAIISGVGD